MVKNQRHISPTDTLKSTTMRKTKAITNAIWYKDHIQLDLDEGNCQISAPRPGILRLSMRLTDGYIPPTELDNSQTPAALSAKWHKAIGNPANITIPLPPYTLKIASTPFRFTLTDKDNIPLLESLPGRTLFQDRHGRQWHYHKKSDHDIYFGLGEKTGRLIRNNHRFRLSNTDAIGYDPESGDPLYKHIPFYLKHNTQHQHTIGIFVNNSAPSEFDFGRERSGYWGPYTAIGIEGGIFDLFICLGPTPQDVLNQYYQITGRPALPSKKSLGYLGSSMYYTELPQGCDQAILDFVAQCQKLDIPISGFHLSSGYTAGPDGKRYVFTWNNTRVPDPADFVAKMTQAGQIISPNTKPGLLTTHPLWTEFDEARAFIRTHDNSQSLTEKFWGGAASFVDFSNPAACQLWKKHLKSALLDHGITAIWNDNNEFELDDDEARCDNNGDPQSAVDLRPLLANWMAETAVNASLEQNPDKRPFILSRAGFAGLQKYAQTWSGDNASTWEDFHFNLATMLGMCLSGLPFNGMDIGGFSGPVPEPELLLRWVQNGIFHPRFSIHSVNSDNTVTEPWLYPAILPQIRKAIRTRYLFLPTIYATAVQQRSVVMPLYFHFPQESTLYDCYTQFMLGESLMAVALTEPNTTEIEISFPPGRWRCFYTQQEFIGPVQYNYVTTLDHSPLFYRAGHGFALDTTYATTDLFPVPLQPNGRIIHLNLRESGHYQIYDDDGTSRQAVINNEQLTIDLHWETTPKQIALHFDSQKAGSYDPEYTAVAFTCDVESICPLSIDIDNLSLAQTRLPDNLTLNHWYFDAQKQLVHLILDSHVLRTLTKLSINFQPIIDITAEMT